MKINCFKVFHTCSSYFPAELDTTTNILKCNDKCIDGFCCYQCNKCCDKSPEEVLKFISQLLRYKNENRDRL